MLKKGRAGWIASSEDRSLQVDESVILVVLCFGLGCVGNINSQRRKKWNLFWTREHLYGKERLDKRQNMQSFIVQLMHIHSLLKQLKL